MESNMPDKIYVCKDSIGENTGGWAEFNIDGSTEYIRKDLTMDNQKQTADATLEETREFFRLEETFVNPHALIIPHRFAKAIQDALDSADLSPKPQSEFDSSIISEWPRVTSRWEGEALIWTIEGKEISDRALRSWVFHNMEHNHDKYVDVIRHNHCVAYAKSLSPAKPDALEVWQSTKNAPYEKMVLVVYEATEENEIFPNYRKVMEAHKNSQEGWLGGDCHPLENKFYRVTMWRDLPELPAALINSDDTQGREVEG